MSGAEGTSTGFDAVALGAAHWPLFLRDGADLGRRRTELRVPVPAELTAETVCKSLADIEALGLAPRNLSGLSVPVLAVSSGPPAAGPSDGATTVTVDEGTLRISFPSACVDSVAVVLVWEALRSLLSGGTDARRQEEIGFGDVLEWQREAAETSHPGSVTGAFAALAAAPSETRRDPEAYRWHEFTGLMPRSLADRERDDLVDMTGIALKTALAPMPSGETTMVGLLSGRELPELAQLVGRLDLLAPLELELDAPKAGHALAELRKARERSQRSYSENPVAAGRAAIDLLTHCAAQGTLLVGAMALPRFDTTGPGPEIVGLDPGYADALAVVDPGSGDVLVRVDTTRVALAGPVLRERLATQLTALADDDAPTDRPPAVGPVEHSGQRAVLSASASPNRSVVDAVWETGLKDSGTIALIGTDRRPVTYRELVGSAAATTRELKRSGVRRGDLVALCTDTVEDFVVGALGAMASGAGFLPIDTSGVRRTLDAVREAGVTAALSASADPSVAGPDVPLVRIATGGDPEQAAVSPEPDELAYAILTSGSSGVPNLVGISHLALSSYVADASRRLGIGPDTVAASPAALVTDLGFTAVWPTLAAGGTLVAIHDQHRIDRDALTRLVADTGVTLMKLTPSHLGALLDDEGRCLPRQTLVLGGERLPAALLRRVRELRPDLTVVNHYGPTETTIGVVAGALGASAAVGEDVPIGTSFDSVALGVSDDEGTGVPFGFEGELLVAGPYLARGYLGNPRLTAERFVPWTWGEPGARAFRTADKVTVAPDGTVNFLGRIDRQVKVRGWRVEPGEIEAAVLADPRVQQAGVVADDNGLLLTAFVVADDGVTQETVLSRLRAQLPQAMVPARVHMVDQLPLLANGKLDRAALGEVSQSLALVMTPPRTDLEVALSSVWCELVGIPEIDVHTSVFTLGAHSLIAMQAASRVRHLLQVDVNVAVFFDHPTIAGLAEHLSSLPEGERIRRRAGIVARVARMSEREVAEMNTKDGSP